MWRKLGVFLAIMMVFVLLLFLIPIVDSWGVHFADPRLESAVKVGLGKRDAHYIWVSRSELAKIHHLDISGRNIQSLEGIELLTKLVTLDASHNMIESVAPLAKLPNLKGLNLASNGFSSLDEINFESISHLPLVELDLSNNGYWPLGESLRMLSDVSSILQFSGLKRLTLDGLPLDDVQFLSKFSNLKELSLEGVPLEDISFVKELYQLEELNLRSTNVRDLSPVRHLSDLRYLNLHSCTHIENLQSLATLRKLETLIIANVDLSQDSEVLAELDSLHRLNVRNTGIEDLEFLRGVDFTSLEELDIRMNPFPAPTAFHDPFQVIREHWNRIPIKYPAVLQPFDVPTPKFSHDGGIHAVPFFLTLEAVEGKVVYYTIDGSDPNPDNVMSDETWQRLPRETRERTFIYTEPINLENLINLPNDISLINTGLPGLISGDFGYVEPTLPVVKIAVVKAAIWDGEYLSPVITNSYVFESERDFGRLPVVSITTARSNLFDHRYGIHIPGAVHEAVGGTTGNYSLRGSSSSRPAYFEFIESRRDTTFEYPVSIRIHGSWTRQHPQKSIRLLFNEDTNNTPIAYDFFEQRDNIFHSSLILRNGGSDVGEGMMRDVVSQELYRHMRFDMQDYIPVEGYVNGEFWGLFNLRERQDEFYFQNKYDVSPEKVTKLEDNALISFGNSYAAQQFISLANTADAMTLDTLDEYMDVTNFLTYNILQLYSANTDWPHNNIAFWRYEGDDKSVSRSPLDGRWRWILFDHDHSFGFVQGPEFDMISYMLTEDRTKYALNRSLLVNLLSHETLKNYFLQSLAMHLNSTFDRRRVIEVITRHADAIRHVIPLQYERWGWPTEEQWNTEVAIMIDYAEKRPEHIRSHIIEFFADVEGLSTLTFTGLDEREDILIESIPLSSKTPGVEIHDGYWSGDFFSGIPITITSEKGAIGKFEVISPSNCEWGIVTIVSPSTAELVLNPNTNVTVKVN